MAETALHLAIRKINLASGRYDSSDYTGLVIFRSRLRRIESELRMIHCFLDQYESRYNYNQVLANWIKEAQKLGILVEEMVDVYAHSLFNPFRRPETRGVLSGILSLVQNYAALLKFVETRQVAFTQLTELEDELQHLAVLKERWVGVVSDSERVPSTGETANPSYQQLVSDFTIEEPVGFDEEKAKLTALLDHKNGPRPVVAVWGPPGSGKTTLVRFVYEQKRSNFDDCEWISMSGYSTAEDLLNKMQHKPTTEPDTTITEKKLLIVLDDITLKDVISEVHVSLKGSQIIVITRNKDIATQVVQDSMEHAAGVEEGSEASQGDSEAPQLSGTVGKVFEEESEITEEQCEKKHDESAFSLTTKHDKALESYIIKLSGLKGSEALQQDSEAVQLFGRVIMEKGSNITEAGVRKIYEDVMQKCPVECEGLPQVIISLGASLSMKQKTQSTRTLKELLDWVSNNNSILNGTQKCLYVAYVNLPMHLKVCLLYCGIFPAGYLLLREKIVRLWVAEGFVEKQKESDVDEEIADYYLMVLTRWGFLQHVDIDDLGRVQSLRMPTVVHELVQSICRKEGFGIASDDVELPQTDTNVRCLFTSKYPQDLQSLIRLQHLRTLIFSESAATNSVLDHNEDRARLSPCMDSIVAVLFASAYLAALKQTGGVFSGQQRFPCLTVLELQGYQRERLPYYIGDLFNLRYLGLRKSRVRYLPYSVTRLYNMQTLDLESSDVPVLPDWIGKLAKLRHLLAGCFSRGVSASKSYKKLKALQTLETIESSEYFAKTVSMLTELTSLCISNMETKYCNTLFLNLSKLLSLSSLTISAKHEAEVLFLDGLCSDQLKSLEFRCCTLQENSLGQLSEKVPNLVSLSLSSVSGIKALKFQLSHFIKLRKLVLRDMMHVETLVIPADKIGSPDENVLRSLEVLHVESLPALKINTEDLGKTNSIKKCFFPQLTDHLATKDEAETSSSRQ